MKSIITKFNDTGSCEIDIDRVVKKWNHLFWVSQYRDSYRLIKQKQINSPVTVLKIVINTVQFEQLKDRLKLVQTKHHIVRNASSWRPVKED